MENLNVKDWIYCDGISHPVAWSPARETNNSEIIPQTNVKLQLWQML